MTAKEKTTEKQARRVDRSASGKAGDEGLLQVIQSAAFFLLGLVLAGAEIFGAYAPFGVAVVGASGPGLGGLCTLLGACTGYLVIYGLDMGLRYCAAGILTFAVAFAFYDLKPCRKVWFMPVVTAVVCGITGAVCLTEQGWTAVDVVFFCTEILLSGAAAYFYRAALTSLGKNGQREERIPLRQSVSLLVLGGTLLIALAGVTLPGGISVGRAAGAMLIMSAARGGGVPGALAGGAVGVALDLASGQPPYYTMVCVMAGGAAGALKRKSRGLAALAYVMVNGAAVLWTWQSGMRLTLLYEAFVGSVCFLLLPEGVHRLAGRVFRTGSDGPEGGDTARRLASRRLTATARAFREVYESIREVFRMEPKEDGAVTDVFDRAADKICRRCALRDACWQRDYANTFNVLSDAAEAMMDRGRAMGGDFSSDFSGRCLHFQEFISAVNEELTAMFCRRQYHSRLQENRAAVCRQYAELDRALGRAAEEINARLTPDPARKKKLRDYLETMGVEGSAEVWYDEQGRLRVELPAAPELREEGELEKLSQMLGVHLREPEESGDRLVLVQTEPLAALASVSGQCKQGESVSGDAGTWFRREDGVLCILLCDGMGTGPEAKKESALTVRLLQNFLKAGVDPEAALCTVNAALALRGEETGSFSTVDLLTVDLFTGTCSVFKYGAAPTYVRTGGQVGSYSGDTLPAGVLSGDAVRPDVHQFRLEEGDWILLVTDGVIGGEEDGWLRENLKEYEGHSPGELADRILAESLARTGGVDDSTVLAVRLDKRSG